MNIFLQKIKSFFMILFFLGFAFVADAQPNSYEQHQIMMNDTLVLTLPGGIPNIPPAGQPANGSFWYSNGGSGLFQAFYVPDPGWTGVETCYLQVQVIGPLGQPTNTFLGYEITVGESILSIERDFESTVVNSSVSIFPLANDSSTSGDLNLKPLSQLYNDGEVEIIGSELIFTPDPNFKGITHLGYIACDDLGTCEKGMVSILVHDLIPPETNSSGSVLTSEDQSIPILIPYYGFEIDNAPSHGTLESIGDYAYLYTPVSGYSGMDNFSFVLPGTVPRTHSVDVEVMNIEAPNNFANDDFAYTPLGTPLDIDAMENDNGNLLEWSIQITSGPSHGIAWPSNGKIHYVPNTGHEGIDQLDYKVANAFGTYETATIYVTTSNFFPALSSFDLSTVDGASLYLKYQVPLKGYYLELVSDGINGTTSVSDNEAVYTPNAGFIGTDQFTIRYCVSGNCFEVDINVDVQPNPNPGTIPCASDDCVWAGDTNRDGIVNGRDALLMCAIGEVGNARPNASLGWFPQESTNWNEPVNGINSDIKFVDGNGDSIITAYDLEAVKTNYGKVNNIYPQAVPTQQNPLIFNLLNTTPQPGDTIEIEVIMGTTTNPALDYSGISFDVLYNPIIFESAWVKFNTHSWLGYDAPVLKYSQQAYEGKLDVAFTRGDETTKSGFGIIGTVYIVVDDISGLKLDPEEEVLVSINSTYGLTGGGHLTKFNDETFEFPLDEVRWKPTEDILKIAPNPTSDFVNILIAGDNVIENINVYNMMGQVVKVISGVDNYKTEISVADLESGIYILEIETDKKPLTRKLEVIKN